MSTTLRTQVLITARALIADKKHWVRGNYAVDANKKTASPYSDDAVRFCAVGAIVRAYKTVTGKSVNTELGENWSVPSVIREEDLDLLEIISEEIGHQAALRAFDVLIAARSRRTREATKKLIEMAA